MNQLQIDFGARDKRLVELATPGHMLVLVAEEARKKGWELRIDVVARLNNAAAAPLAQLDHFSIRRLAQRIDDVATSLLRDLNVDDPREALYCVAKFVAILVDEGRYTDPLNNAVLVSLLLIEDIKDDAPDEKGQLVVWKLDEKKWEAKAKELIRRANIMGYYGKDQHKALLTA